MDSKSNFVRGFALPSPTQPAAPPDTWA
ncbi:hypothetical protein ECEC1737_2287, partial [Escherichia coli EC1737]